MATATINPPTIDLKTQATYPLRLGSSIGDAESLQYSSIRYNHKPQLRSSETITAQIHAGKEPGTSRLTIDAQDGEYTYAGRSGKKDDNFVLVVRGQGKDRELVLERISNGHAFNLNRTPAEPNASKLASQYPQLQDESDDDMFGEDEEDMPPDDLNPFDYRHFLKTELNKPETTNANLDAARSTAATPVVQPRPTTTGSAVKLPKRTASKPQPLKRKAPAVNKANPKRVKAGQEPPSAAASASKPKTRPEVPRINLDRKASLRRPSLDDGELILENETPISEKPPRPSAMAMALNGQLGKLTGPISLQSAANSPGSHMASPEPVEEEDAEGQYVFEFEDEPEADNHQVPNDDGVEVEEDADADGDVDDFELPSPAQSKPSAAGQLPPSAADEDDDLDQQLAAAMMEEESEESEEE